MPTLEWANRNEAVRAASRAPFRLLEHDAALSFGDSDNENMLIQGDNLVGLKALLPYFASRVKCIAIDPPYNTRSAFERYDDNLEHSTWLSIMCPRLELLRDLLAEEGSIWVNIDDFEVYYLKVIMDEVFGRKNFITTAGSQKKVDSFLKFFFQVLGLSYRFQTAIDKSTNFLSWEFFTVKFIKTSRKPRSVNGDECRFWIGI